MNEFEFTLIYRLKNKEEDPSKYLDTLYEAGCDDAIVSTGKKGIISLDFIREGEKAKPTIFSAMSDIKKAIPDASLIEASPDFVTTTDLAKIFVHTRQNTRKLMSKKNSPFPIHMGSPSLWHLSVVLNWLKKENNITRYGVNERMVAVANVTKQVNLSIAMPDYDESIKEFVT